ncbi:leucine-rich repeat domain-containing protein [Alistipes senegalensis]|uniref:Leucine-rich repeat domain-containing protein n=1 Tax=Alistipes senegalensis JC50 TaxID=1033732 RepID=A0ABY5V9A1_9BACT|nr:leucine-rich repeat domain-containing protein [Alistipes senegalensis]UEA86163.1 leucine-rich repeat domain-containing protein [Alistipes senegalensis]UWN66251.1 leucine-rich repeat domain-containing protein [Alistipes senegalensis JC50]
MEAIDVSIAPLIDDKTIVLAEPGTLEELLRDNPINPSAITELTIIGSLNYSDMSMLSRFNNLRVLDMENVISEGIGAYTFYLQKRLTSIKLPKTLKTIGEGAFDGCSNLTGNLTIPESVTTIGDGAFYGCTGFTGNLTIPKGVTTIEPNTFRNCSGLTGNLTIPEGVTTIGSSAFRECKGFTGLTLSEGVTTIEDEAFGRCSEQMTENLTIPKSVTTIGKNAFSKIMDLYCKAMTPPQIQEDSFFLTATTTLYIPKNCTEVYRTAPGWSELTFKAIIEIDF